MDHASNTCKQDIEVVIVSKDKTLVSPEDKIPAHLEVELEWFNFAEVNEFVVTDLNEDAEATVEALQESFDEQLVAENSSGGPVATVKDRDCEGNVKDEENDGGFDLGNYNDDGWAAGVDDYYLGDDSGIDLDEQPNKDMKKTCNRYEENSG